MSIKLGNELGEIRPTLGSMSAVLVVLFHLDRNLNQTIWKEKTFQNYKDLNLS